MLSNDDVFLRKFKWEILNLVGRMVIESADMLSIIYEFRRQNLVLV